ncbi:glycosyltransferase [Sporolactobacillus shoreicorticis]|uniref:Glycosyltransferase n=1 Tax=Sporolactobacillus shoreicorticis TaxID=1923877 RepID=A0ABW5S6F9_9BACL|nr:glycosyltransferase [Sporolactobacillus shoreicorticis]MCO7124210.1 glycosyltransferase [Sporolactobacillus shoreicorticis]
MKLLVNATANDARGALALTDSFLKDMNEQVDFLKQNQIFLYVLVSNQNLESYANNYISILFNNYPKKSLIHKYYFEHIYLPKFIKKEKISTYLSLQNTAIRKGPYKQIVLIHTPLPFENLSIRDTDIKSYIKYHFILRTMLKHQIKHMDQIFTQTEWMKRSVNKLCTNEHIKVIRPSLCPVNDLCGPLPSDLERSIDLNKRIKLIYPTNVDKYKNNERLVKAVKAYNRTHDQHKVTIYLTAEGQSSPSVVYMGKVPYESMGSLYKKMNALIFPSLTETLGLPLLEAQSIHLPILVADRAYAREICKNSAIYFNPVSIDAMIQAIEQFISQWPKRHSQNQQVINETKQRTDYTDYIKVIKEQVYHG